MNTEITAACPGDVLGSAEAVRCGPGTYTARGQVLASLAGTVTWEDTELPNTKLVRITPWNTHNATDTVISVGDQIIGEVTKLGTTQASVDIIAVEDRVLQQRARGSIRREDARVTETDALVMHTVFRPGDVVRASVISLGDARQYFLSTAAKELGVLRAKGSETGNELVAISLQV